MGSLGAWHAKGAWLITTPAMTLGISGATMNLFSLCLLLITTEQPIQCKCCSDLLAYSSTLRAYFSAEFM